ncbi:MAG: glycosyltransferase family 2 protein [Alphaproteobacteria bacterium]|nr:glycosyltransferase family 2 protein [Alphaproteobacteria bacterium]
MTKNISSRKSISIIVSAYNEEGNVKPLYDALLDVLPKLKLDNYEIIYVNDGSKDLTKEKILELQKKDSHVKLVNFKRNFGHEIAMSAGMDYSNCDACIFMDADLQHPPVYIKEMVEKWQKGADIVLTKRIDNVATSALYKFMSACFYRILNLLSDTKIPEKTPDFRLLDKKYVNFLKQFKEGERLFRGLLNYIMPIQGVEYIEFSAPERFSGSSKYSFKKSFALAFSTIVQFSVKPLRFSIYLGLFTAFASLCLGGYFFFEYFFLNNPTPGFATVMATMGFLGSIQLIMLGILGEYIGKIHLEVKRRPLYIADFIESNPSNSEKEEIIAKPTKKSSTKKVVSSKIKKIYKKASK